MLSESTTRTVATDPAGPGPKPELAARLNLTRRQRPHWHRGLCSLPSRLRICAGPRPGRAWAAGACPAPASETLEPAHLNPHTRHHWHFPARPGRHIQVHVRCRARRPAGRGRLNLRLTPRGRSRRPFRVAAPFCSHVPSQCARVPSVSQVPIHAPGLLCPRPLRVRGTSPRPFCLVGRGTQ